MPKILIVDDEVAMLTLMRRALEDAGFTGIRIRPKESSRELIREWTQGGNIADYVVSATIEAVKP